VFTNQFKNYYQPFQCPQMGYSLFSPFSGNLILNLDAYMHVRVYSHIAKTPYPHLLFPGKELAKELLG